MSINIDVIAEVGSVHDGSFNNAMKLVVFGFPITKVIDYLKKIQWKGNYNLLINLIDIIKDFGDKFGKNG